MFSVVQTMNYTRAVTADLRLGVVSAGRMLREDCHRGRELEVRELLISMVAGSLLLPTNPDTLIIIIVFVNGNTMAMQRANTSSPSIGKLRLRNLITNRLLILRHDNPSECVAGRDTGSGGKCSVLVGAKGPELAPMR
jgi:hypothetical protein